jgi:hypothetical protein
MNIETITDKIIKQADTELKSRIEEACKPLDKLLRNGCSYEVSGPAGYDDNSAPFKAMWFRAMNALMDSAFQQHFEKNRQDAINQFVSKFNALDAQFQELREQVEEAQ